jgi:outer membrane protein TolC
LFKSPALNALIERALQNNPNLQSALASLRTTKESVYAQEGKFFPLAQANFNPSRQRTSAALSPVLSTPASVFNLVTAQVLVSYTFDVWGLNRRTVESLEALADVQRFQVEAAYLALTANLAVAAITEASLRGQIEATEQMISINKKILDIIRHQFETGFVSRNEVALQEAALAQVEATLPPLRKALAQQRDLMRPDRRRNRQHTSQLHHQRQRWLHQYRAPTSPSAAEPVLETGWQCHSDGVRRRHVVASAPGR